MVTFFLNQRRYISYNVKNYTHSKSTIRTQDSVNHNIDENEGLNDARGNLFFHILRIAKHHQVLNRFFCLFSVFD